MPRNEAAARGRVPAAAADAFLDERTATYTPNDSVSQALRVSLNFRRLTTALHRRGVRPTAEVLVAALVRLQPQDRDAVLDLAERIVAFEPEVIARLDTREWPPAPVWGVA
jgi:hypothetical protein